MVIPQGYVTEEKLRGQVQFPSINEDATVPSHPKTETTFKKKMLVFLSFGKNISHKGNCMQPLLFRTDSRSLHKN